MMSTASPAATIAIPNCTSRRRNSAGLPSLAPGSGEQAIWAPAPDAKLLASRPVMALRRWPSTAEYPGFLLLELGLGQQAGIHQLPQLGEVGESLGGVVGLRLRRGGRVLRWRWRLLGLPRRGLLVLRGPPRLLSALHAAMHRAGDGHGGCGF